MPLLSHGTPRPDHPAAGRDLGRSQWPTICATALVVPMARENLKKRLVQREYHGYRMGYKYKCIYTYISLYIYIIKYNGKSGNIMGTSWGYTMVI